MKIALITAGTLLAAFYFLILKPKLELPSALFTAEEVMSGNSLNLLQNRLSLIGLVGIDTSNPMVANEKEFLILKLAETNKIGLERASKVPVVTGLNNYPELLAENMEILERQTELIEKLTTLGNANKNIFRYNPETDLGNLNPETERDEILSRTSAAIEGLESIKSKTTSEELIAKITKTQNRLNSLADELTDGNALDAGRIFDEVSREFLEMRQIGLALEIELIKSPEIIELIKDQTNLMLEYDFWLGKIDEAQEKLLDQNLYGLF